MHDLGSCTIDVADLCPGTTRAVEIAGHRLLLCNVEGEIFAVRNTCPHQEFGLDAARLSGSVLECSLHGGRYDVRSGSPVRAPTRDSLVTYPVLRRGDVIEIRLPPR